MVLSARPIKMSAGPSYAGPFKRIGDGMTKSKAPRASKAVRTARRSRVLPCYHEDRHASIAEAAYFRAEHRGFTPGHELEDWLAAEEEVDERLMGEGRAS
jgi:hypothetical protein